MVSLKQPGWGGGIISPQALGRTDQTKYAVGLRQCINAWVTRYGTIENRSGTIFCSEVKDSSQKLRLAPFVFSSTVSYLLEVGNDYMRVFEDGARVSVAGAAAYAGGTTYGIGDLVTYSAAVYRSLVAANVGHQPDISSTQWAAQAGSLLEIITTIPQASLAAFQYVQQNDIMTIVEHGIAPCQLLRYSTVKWIFVPFTQSVGVDAPTGVAAVAGVPVSAGLGTPTGVTAVGGNSSGVGILTADQYRVSAYDDSPERLSVACALVRAQDSVPNFSRATALLPVLVSWSAVSGAVGYAVYRKDRAASDFGLIALTSGLSFSDDYSMVQADIVGTAKDNASSGTTYSYVVTAISSTTGAESLQGVTASCLGDTPSVAHPNVISWVASTGASQYRIYRIVNGVPGFIGQQPSSPFNDINIAPDTSIQPPSAFALFSTSSDYPAVCGYYQQRLFFANTVNEPQTVWASNVGNDYNFTETTPVTDDSALQFTLAGKQVQPVRALVDLGKLILHSSNAEYVAQGNQAGALTPTTVSITATGSAGCASVPPVVIGNTDLFVQEGATRLNDLRYEVQSFAFTGKDVTKLATDLFRGRTIVDMAWQKLPHSIVWCVLDNGQMVGLTYVREDDIWAWHLHSSTNGAFENVCVVTEGAANAVYVVVRRTISGATKRYIERLAPRDCLDTVMFTDSVFADAALTYDGRNTGSTTMTATTGAGWTPSDLLTLTSSVGYFVSGDVSNVIVFQQIDSTTDLVTDSVSFTIMSYVGTTSVRAQAQRDVPTWARVALTTWGKAVRSFSGIGHLEGQALAVLADGNVVANPLDDKYPTITVASGAFALASPAMVVTAGLPVQMDLQTLPVENATGATIANKRIIVTECTPIFHASRGGSFGQDSGHLNAWKQPKTSGAGYPVDGYTGPFRVPIQGTPQPTGQVWIRNTDPVPFGLSAIVVTGEIGS